MSGAAFMLFTLVCVALATQWVLWGLKSVGATKYGSFAIALVCSAAPSILLAIIQH